MVSIILGVFVPRDKFCKGMDIFCKGIVMFLRGIGVDVIIGLLNVDDTGDIGRLEPFGPSMIVCENS